MSKLKYWREKEKLSKLLQVLVKQMYSVNESILCVFLYSAYYHLSYSLLNPNTVLKLHYSTHNLSHTKKYCTKQHTRNMKLNHQTLYINLSPTKYSNPVAQTTFGCSVHVSILKSTYNTLSCSITKHNLKLKPFLLMMEV